MSEQRVKTFLENGVGGVTLSRPGKKNALDLAMFEGLAEAAEKLRGEPDLRAVVLNGEGSAFCSGLDVQNFMADPQVIGRLLQKTPGETANLAQRVAWTWREMPVPVIAALQGEVFGGGLQIALGADIRIAATDAALSVMEIRWGIIPDMAGSRILKDLVAYDVAMELALTGRILGAEEAARIGLVTGIAADPLAEAMRLASAIAGRSPDAVRAVKYLLRKSGRLGDEEGLELETRLQMSLLGGRNQMEAARAGLERREPEFVPASIEIPK
jgi:enoyl-CoA hydratase/carnithine racemase